MLLAVALLNSSSAARCASFGSTTCAMRSIGQSVNSGTFSLQIPAMRRSGACARPLRACRTLPRRRDIGIRPVDAVVDVLVGVRPEVVVDIGPEHVIEEVVIGVRPEHRTDPADHDAAAPPWPVRAMEPAVEARRPHERGPQSRIGDRPAAPCRVAAREAGARQRCGRGERPRRISAEPPGEPAVVAKPHARAADARRCERAPGEAAADVSGSDAWAPMRGAPSERAPTPPKRGALKERIPAPPKRCPPNERIPDPPKRPHPASGHQASLLPRPLPRRRVRPSRPHLHRRHRFRRRRVRGTARLHRWRAAARPAAELPQGWRPFSRN